MKSRTIKETFSLLPGLHQRPIPSRYRNLIGSADLLSMYSLGRTIRPYCIILDPRKNQAGWEKNQTPYFFLVLTARSQPQHFYDQLGLICFLSKNCAIVFQRVQYLSQKMLYKIHSCRQLDKQFKLFWFKSF